MKEQNLNNIFRQPFAKLSDILQGARLIDALVKKDFGVDNTSLMELQKMDFDLKPFYDMAMERSSKVEQNCPILRSKQIDLEKKYF